MTFPLVGELAADGVPVAVTCRVLEISRSAFSEWVRGGPSQRDWDDAHRTNTIMAIGVMARRSYGAPRVHAELRLGLGVYVGRTPVARLMRHAGVVGISHRRTTPRPRTGPRRPTHPQHHHHNGAGDPPAHRERLSGARPVP